MEITETIFEDKSAPMKRLGQNIENLLGIFQIFRYIDIIYFNIKQ